jgi:hypothetical protein
LLLQELGEKVGKDAQQSVGKIELCSRMIFFLLVTSWFVMEIVKAKEQLLKTCGASLSLMS